jgi:TolA-binding protein
MTRIFLQVFVVLLLAGCASWQQEGGVLYSFAQSRSLAKGITLLEKGDTAGAIRLFEAIGSAEGVEGVTDEALFRLALLSLKPQHDRDGNAFAEQALNRLVKEYPGSQWSVTGKVLAGVLSSCSDQQTEFRNSRAELQSEITELRENQEELKGKNEDLRRQNRNCRSLNLSLTRGNRELLQNIEKLKILDIELERKVR